jgi:hypothetical protein
MGHIHVAEFRIELYALLSKYILSAKNGISQQLACSINIFNEYPETEQSKLQDEHELNTSSKVLDKHTDKFKS